MVENAQFMEYVNKRFSPGDKVTVFGLGPSMPGEYSATVCGPYGMEPHEMYIIGWDKPAEINKLAREKKQWTHCVMSKACMRLTNTAINIT